jgi:hypothetical protein
MNIRTAVDTDKESPFAPESVYDVARRWWKKRRDIGAMSVAFTPTPD